MSTTLAELRRLNIEQQRAEQADKEEKAAPGSEAEGPTNPAPLSSGTEQSLTGASEQVSTQADAHVRTPADAAMLAPASDHVLPPASAPLRDRSRAAASDRALTQSRAPASTQTRKPAATVQKTVRASSQTNRHQSAPSEADEQEDFVAMVRERVRAKRFHPGGTKPSVDMDPDLLLRARRYCLDNGNPPLRNVLIELLSAYLEDEGY